MRNQTRHKEAWFFYLHSSKKMDSGEAIYRCKDETWFFLSGVSCCGWLKNRFLYQCLSRITRYLETFAAIIKKGETGDNHIHFLNVHYR